MPPYRETRLIKSAVLDATTGETLISPVPEWAISAQFVLSVIDVNGSADTVDYKLKHVIRKAAGVVAVAESTQGATGTPEVQTVTLTGGPTHGTFVLGFTGESANVSVNTGPLPFDASAALVADELNRAIQRAGAYGPPGANPVGVTRSGAGTSGDPYIYEVTFSGPGVTAIDLDLLTATSLDLYIEEADADLQGWDGITQLTDVGDIIVQVGPAEPNTTDDTGPIYRIQTQLPDKLAHVLAFTSTDETYTYTLWATYTG